jgi:VWFA-related protein
VDVRLIAVLAFAAAAAAAPQAQAPQSVFHSGVDAVQVDVSVTHDGKPVAGLTAKDFEVSDNGVRQVVRFVDVASVPVDLLLDVDVSASVAGDRLASLKAACRAAIGALRPIDRAGVLSFSGQITEQVPMTASRDQVAAGLDALSGAGNTSLYEAVYAGLLLGTAAESRTLLLVFSDGQDTLSWLTPAAVLEAARHSAVVVYAVSTQPFARSRVQQLLESPDARPAPGHPGGGPLLSDFLYQVTTLSGGRLLAPDEPGLANRFVSIVEEFQNRYVLAYTPTGVSGSGWHTITVRVLRKGLDVRSRPGYWR